MEPEEMSQPVDEDSVGYIENIQEHDNVVRPENNIEIQPEVIELHQCNNAWKPSFKRNLSSDPETGETMALAKCIRRTLNKITPQNFQRLLEYIRGFLCVVDEESLAKVMEMIYERAVFEPRFSSVYARMCKDLAIVSPHSTTDPEEVINFRKLLVNRCQKEFEKDKHELTRDTGQPNIEMDNGKELDEPESKERLRALGNIRFIGELYKLELLCANILHKCLEKLINGGDEFSFECLSRLLTTAGKELDNTKHGMLMPPSSPQRMDGYFGMMVKIVEEKKISSRVRFMLQDVLELRSNGWVPRRAEIIPKALEEIRREAELEGKKASGGKIVENHQSSVTSSRPEKGATGSDEKVQENKPKAKAQWRHRKYYRNVSKTQNIPADQSGKPDDEHLRKVCVTSPQPEKGATGSDEKVQENKPKAKAQWRHRKYYRSASKTQNNTADQSGKPDDEHLRKVCVTSPQPEKGATGSDEKVEENKPKAKAQWRHRNYYRSVSQTQKNTADQSGKPDNEHLRKACVESVNKFLTTLEFIGIIKIVNQFSSHSNISFWFDAVFKHVLLRSRSDRIRIGFMLHYILITEIITVQQFLDGLKSVIEKVNSSVASDNLAEILSQTMVDGTISFNSLKSVYKNPFNSNIYPRFEESVVRSLVVLVGEEKVREMWRNSGFNEVQLEPHLKRECLSHDVFSSFLGKANFKLKLGRWLNEEIDEDFFDMVKEVYVKNTHTPVDVLISVMIAIVKISVEVDVGAEPQLNEDVFSSRLPLAVLFLNGDAAREMAALYTIQSYAASKGYRTELLLRMFELVSEHGTVSDAGFISWSESENVANPEEHQKAVQALKTFLDRLKRENV